MTALFFTQASTADTNVNVSTMAFISVLATRCVR